MISISTFDLEAFFRNFRLLTFSRISVPNDYFVFGVVFAWNFGGFRKFARVLDNLAR